MKIATVCLLVCALSLGTGLVLAQGDPRPEAQVQIDNFSFKPQVLTIKAGTQVTWLNKDDVPHTVVSTEKRFSSPVLDTDGKFTRTFADPGTYDYYCSVHPHMKAKVIVQ